MKINFIAVVVVGLIGCPDSKIGEGEGELGEGEGETFIGEAELGVRCGAEICTAPQVCCLEDQQPTFVASCVSAGTACAAGDSLLVVCDGPEDCGANQECCLDDSSSCAPQGTCAPSVLGKAVVCAISEDCAAGEGCCPLETVAPFRIQGQVDIGLCLIPSECVENQ